MSKMKIAAVGFESADPDVEHLPLEGTHSLFDYDIVMISPTIISTIYAVDTYQGKPSLSDDASAKFRDIISHWRKEIHDFCESGKVAIIFLGEKIDVFIATGERQYSGTGRNRQTTRIVTESSNYAFIPLPYKFTQSNGKSMILSQNDKVILEQYWKRFENISTYMVYIDHKNLNSSIITRSGNRTVGTICRSAQSPGALILLPSIDFDSPQYTREENDDYVWTDEGIIFFKSLTHEIISLSARLKNTSEATPHPEWANNDLYKLDIEIELLSSILKIDGEIESLSTKKDELEHRLSEEAFLRALLFEKGKALERAVIKAIEIIGFTATPFSNGSSEFDLVFFSDEGRLIGEVEGKDNEPINVTKLRQLALNIHEDLAREEIERPAKGVLFGNPFRLTVPSDREEPFTAKCISSCSATGTALVQTLDLFFVAKFLSNHSDTDFASKCRSAILNTTGRVVFPRIPDSPSV